MDPPPPALLSGLVARDGSPDDPNNYPDSEPTQYANYGGTGGEAYSEYQQPDYGASGGFPFQGGQYPAPEPPTPWYRRPAALVGLGVLTALALTLLVYAVVKFTTSNGTGPAGTSTTPPTSPGETTSAQQTVAPAPGGTTQTVTVSPTPTSAEETTTEAPETTTTEEPSTSTSTTVSTSVSTVTETVTTTRRVLPTLPIFPRPDDGQ